MDVDGGDDLAVRVGDRRGDRGDPDGELLADPGVAVAADARGGGRGSAAGIGDVRGGERARAARPGSAPAPAA